MNSKVSAIRTEQWRKIVCDCIHRNPQLSKRQWCEENGIRYRSYMYWQRKFQMDVIEQIEEQGISLPVKSAHDVPAVFADLTDHLETLSTGHKDVPSDSDQKPESLAPELMIQTENYRIYVNGSVQETTLQKVIRAIRHA